MSQSTVQRRSRRAAACSLALAALLLGWAAAAPAKDERPTEMPYETPGAVPTLDPSTLMMSRKVVVITDQALNPRLVKLDEKQLVAWLSYSSVPSVIVFEREVAKNMICHSLVNFSLKEDELRSSPIHAGEFASFCQLKPGRYKYSVVRPDPGTHSASAAKRLEGEIVVGGATGGGAVPEQ
jgi:hypothetical protein